MTKWLQELKRDLDKILAWKKLKFNVLFVGDDWYQSPAWNSFKSEFNNLNVAVIDVPYTDSISSTKINKVLDGQRRKSSDLHRGLGRDRTGDLTIFSRSLVPTELPSQTRFQCHLPKGIRHQNLCDPDGT